jgi:DNA invertase Pin-like site-specific DNA recombinase
VEAERTIRRLEFNGIRIISTSDGYDSTSKARKVHRGFKGLMNEIFIDDLRERVSGVERARTIVPPHDRLGARYLFGMMSG